MSKAVQRYLMTMFIIYAVMEATTTGLQLVMMLMTGMLVTTYYMLGGFNDKDMK